MTSSLEVDVSRPVSLLLTPWVLVVVLLGLSTVFLWPTWQTLHGYWPESTRYSHGHLVVLISAYLLYRLKPVLSNAELQPALWALLPLSVFIFIWLVAVLGSIQAIHEIVLPLILWTMCLTVFGWKVARRMGLAIGYLYLAIPIWESGNFILQWATVQAVDIGLLLFGIPAFIDGNTVHLSVGSFEIAGGCSGLHYFIVGIAISVLYGSLYLRSMRKRVLLVIVAIALALLTNWLRVFIVVYAGHVTDMQHYLVAQNHYYFGWVLFMFAMIPFILFARSMEDEESEPARSDSDENIPAAVVWSYRIRIAVSSSVVLLITASAITFARMPAIEQGQWELSLPTSQGEWAVAAQDSPAWQPFYKGTVAEALRAYTSREGTVTFYANLYRGQTQGNELIGYENHIEGMETWTIARSVDHEIEAGGGQTWRVRESLLRSKDDATRILYYWYYVDERNLAHGLLTKLNYGFKAILGVPDTGVQVLSARCQGDCDDARQLIEAWLDVYLPHDPGRIFQISERKENIRQ